MTGGSGADVPAVVLEDVTRVHLVGVGGAGMSGIARMLLQRGHLVAGSDRQHSRTIEMLRAMGADVHVGHHADALGDADVLVVSSAIAEDNPEVVAARERGIRVVHRSEMLAALMYGQLRVLVAGTHGKTTTTAMTVVALHAVGRDPSFAIGGALNETGSNAHAGSGDVFVAEADESDRSFLAYRPDVAVVTNVELDHPDAFEDDDDTTGAFMAFLDRMPEEGVAVICRDDAGSAEVAARARRRGMRVLTYGEDPRADVRLITDPSDGAEIRHEGGLLSAVEVDLPGRHNLLNATAALTVCHVLEVDVAAAARGLATFTGPQRRFQRLGAARGVQVVDDYAHHPTELRAVLAAGRSVADGRVVLVVQPHRFSRTAAMGPELGRAAAGADLVVVTDVYGADEEPVPGVSGELVVAGAREAGGSVVWEPHLGDVASTVADLVRPGDLVLVTGAGDVGQVGPELLSRLRGEDVAAPGAPGTAEPPAARDR